MIALADLTRMLDLTPHPEGGYFRETFRSDRGASTSIYFALGEGQFSAFHRVRSADEVWHYYGGAPVEIVQIAFNGHVDRAVLGLDFEQGQRPQIVVPASVLQAAACIGVGYSLCGCTVAPAFNFSDFEMPSRAELLAQYPNDRATIERFTRA